MKQFELVLKNEKEKSYRSVSIILLVLNFIGILILTYLKGFTKWGPLIISLIAAFSLFASYYFKNKNEKISFSAGFLLFSFAWQTAGYWVISILNLVFSVLNVVALQKPIVRISESQIIYPSFPKRKISWTDLNNLILKDGLLTIDFKNNKLIQQYVADASANISEKEFNEFCSQQLNK